MTDDYDKYTIEVRDGTKGEWKKYSNDMPYNTFSELMQHMVGTSFGALYTDIRVVGIKEETVKKECECCGQTVTKTGETRDVIVGGRNE